MRVKLPKPRLRLRTLLVLVGLSAVALGVGLHFWSPTRRLSRLLRPDQPAYVRREAASSLGYRIPPWEVEQAVGILIGALNDPSPRVREYAAAGLAEHKTRAERAVPKLVALLDDGDRYVRYTSAAALGLILPPQGKVRDQALPALIKTLNDPDPAVRLEAANSLARVGAGREAIGTLVAAIVGDEPLRTQARLHMTRGGFDTRPLVAPLTAVLRDKDERRRRAALDVLIQIGSPATVRSALDSARAGDDPDVRRWADEAASRLAPTPAP